MRTELRALPASFGCGSATLRIQRLLRFIF